MDLFVGGGIESKRASAESGIEKYGWNGEIYGACASIMEVDKVQRLNLHEFMKYASYKRAEYRLRNPQPKKKNTNQKKKRR